MRGSGLAGKMAAAAAAVAVAVLGLSGAAGADVAKESSKIGGAKVTLWLHPFLDETELATLRLIATNKDALAMFVPSEKGFAAIALSPDEGFIRGGKPAASASAIAEMPDAASAAAKALEMCNAAKSGAADCVVVVEIAP